MRDCSQGLNSQEMRRSITIQRRLPSQDFVGHVGRKNPGFDDFSAAMYVDRLGLWRCLVRVVSTGTNTDFLKRFSESNLEHVGGQEDCPP